MEEKGEEGGERERDRNLGDISVEIGKKGGI